jgi:hypothetical protein
MIYVLFYLQNFEVKYLKFVSLIYFFLYRLLLVIHKEYDGVNASSIDLLLVSSKNCIFYLLSFYDALSIVYYSYHIKGLKLIYLSFVWDIIERSWSNFSLAPPKYFF